VKILFDHNLPRRLREHLPGHEIRTTREMNWEQLRNGALMSVAASSGFEVFVTIDKQIEHQQNLTALALAVVVIDGKYRTRYRRCCPLRRLYATCLLLHLNVPSTLSSKAGMYVS